MRLPLKRKAVELNSATAGGALKVRPIWLTVSPTERYLLLEDTATGDVLLPLIYMKVGIHPNPTAPTPTCLFPHPLDWCQSASQMPITGCHVTIRSDSCRDNRYVNQQVSRVRVT